MDAASIPFLAAMNWPSKITTLLNPSNPSAFPSVSNPKFTSMSHEPACDRETPGLQRNIVRR